MKFVKKFILSLVLLSGISLGASSAKAGCSVHLGDFDWDSANIHTCLLYTSPSPRDRQKSRMPSSA